MDGPVVLGLMVPKCIHATKLQEKQGGLSLEIRSHTHPHSKLHEGIIVLDGIYPNGKIDPKINGFCRAQGFVFSQVGPVSEVDTCAETSIGK
jgi:hypothetical protein